MFGEGLFPPKNTRELWVRLMKKTNQTKTGVSHAMRNMCLWAVFSLNEKRQHCGLKGCLAAEGSASLVHARHRAPSCTTETKQNRTETLSVCQPFYIINPFNPPASQPAGWQVLVLPMFYRCENTQNSWPEAASIETEPLSVLAESPAPGGCRPPFLLMESTLSSDGSLRTDSIHFHVMWA